MTPEPRTLLAATTKSGPLTCSSHHHQGVDRLGQGLLVSGRSPDGLVEAIEVPIPDMDTTNRSEAEITWMLGVQWHPEETAANDPAQQSLFDAVVNLARLRGSRARPRGVTRPQPRLRPRGPRPFLALELSTHEAARIAAIPTCGPGRSHRSRGFDRGAAGSRPNRSSTSSCRSSPWCPATEYVDPLRALGYRWMADPWDDEHEYFSLDDADGARRFQIHACRAGGAWERRHLAFRDTLRAEPQTAAAYEALKRDLAVAHPHDLMAYVDGKTAFIRGIEARDVVEPTVA